MSLETWKKEYLRPMRRNIIESLKRDLNKWIGLRKKNLEKHGLRQQFSNLVEPNMSSTLWIGLTTCNQCRLHCRGSECRPSCPLLKALNGLECDAPTPMGRSPYAEWTCDKDPEPMIRLIRKALRKAKNDNKKKP